MFGSLWFVGCAAVAAGALGVALLSALYRILRSAFRMVFPSRKERKDPRLSPRTYKRYQFCSHGRYKPVSIDDKLKMTVEEHFEFSKLECARCEPRPFCPACRLPIPKKF